VALVFGRDGPLASKSGVVRSGDSESFIDYEAASTAVGASPINKNDCDQLRQKLSWANVPKRKNETPPVLIVSKLLMRVIKAHARWRWRA